MEVQCTITGNIIECVYDTQNTLNELLEDLEKGDIFFADKNEIEGVVIDGTPYRIFHEPKHPFQMENKNVLGKTLHDLGVKWGSMIVLSGYITFDGPLVIPIRFFCNEGIECQSEKWGEKINWCSGDSLTESVHGIEGCIWEVLPKKIDIKSVYVTLHGYAKNGQIKTVFENRSLDEVGPMTYYDHSPYWGYICFVFSKPQRRKLGW